MPKQLTFTIFSLLTGAVFIAVGAYLYFSSISPQERLQNFPCQEVERHNKPEVELKTSSELLLNPTLGMEKPYTYRQLSRYPNRCIIPGLSEGFCTIEIPEFVQEHNNILEHRPLTNYDIEPDHLHLMEVPSTVYSLGRYETGWSSRQCRSQWAAVCKNILVLYPLKQSTHASCSNCVP